ALTATVSFYAFSAQAEINIDLSTATQAQVEQAIANAALAGDSDGIAGLLAQMAQSDSPLLGSVLAFAAQAMPSAMTTVMSEIKAVVTPEQAQQVLATIISALGDSNADIIAALNEQNQDLIALGAGKGDDVEPAAGGNDDDDSGPDPIVVPPTPSINRTSQN
ncbi:MAG: hypothetical protein OXQ96_02165, partial [Alphaproteobacteria bacterium]|nr:hypothetical protein [Alphaproteobacteria bacterium]